MRTSWYPLMAVLKTTSPTASPRAPSGWPFEDPAVGQGQDRPLAARHHPLSPATRPSRITTRPPTTVSHRAPSPPPGRRTASCGPSSGSARARSRGRARSRTVTSPGAPGASVPAGSPSTRAGPTVSRERSVEEVGTLRRTRSVTERATIVSSPRSRWPRGRARPPSPRASGARRRRRSRQPSRRGDPRHASTSRFERSGGFILKLGSKARTASSVRRRWCGHLAGDREAARLGVPAASRAARRSRRGQCAPASRSARRA